GARPVTRPATRISSPISSLAEKAAASDPSGVRTTIIGPSGDVIQPVEPPDGWRPIGAVAPKMALAALEKGEPVGPKLIETSSGAYVVLNRPVSDRAGMAVVQFSSPLDKEVEELLLSFRIAFGGALLILVGVALTLGRPLASLALRPLRRLTETVSGISPSDLSARVQPPPADDHLRELALAFNHMLARIDRSVEAERRGQEQLRR